MMYPLEAPNILEGSQNPKRSDHLTITKRPWKWIFNLTELCIGVFFQSIKIHRLHEHPESYVNFEPSASPSQSDSDSEDSDRRKRESLSRKRKKPGQDADGNVTWTDESVRFLFETYDSIHKRLWEESKGQVKYQKKWTPILKAMQAKFGDHFTKKQCQSKYWSVRRECTEYRYSVFCKILCQSA